MKLLFSVLQILVVLIFFKHEGYAQDSIPRSPCKMVDLENSQQKIVIFRDFINKSRRENWFLNDKGIIHLYIYNNPDSSIEWTLQPVIDDQYKDNPTPNFALVNTGIVVLIYDENRLKKSLKYPDSEEINKCLSEIIGDRVYIRPKKQYRWNNNQMFNGRKLEGARSASTGSGGAIKIIFRKDGSIEIVSLA